VDDEELPKSGWAKKVGKHGLEVGAGLIPFAGGLLAAAASAWSEHDQERVDEFFHHWLQMLSDEMKEKAQTIIEIAERLDLQDDKINARMESKEYQSLLRKAFREWSAAESEAKREYVRNILANAAATSVVTDDVIKMFLDWLKTYSELHFQVISKVYNHAGITRGGIWAALGRTKVTEDAADADLYKLLIRDLSTGSIIRQHVERDYYGNAVARPIVRRPKGSGPKPPVSAFDEVEQYELTQLGQQFVHYAMTDLPLRIADSKAPEPSSDTTKADSDSL
jgi:hypothetical protein